MKTFAWLILGLLSSAAVAAPPPPPERARPTTGLPGTTVHRVDEPVFKGEAVVYEAGKEHAQTVLLVHGLGDAGAHDYASQVPWLARSYHVLAVDLPGFARSDKGASSYSPTTYTAFLKFVADRFARKPFMLVGHSMGAVVVLRYAATHPDDLKRLVVIDAPGLLHRAAYTGDFLTHIGLGLLQSRTENTPAAGMLGEESMGIVTDKLNQILGRVEQTNIDPQMILAIPALRQKMLAGDPMRIAGLAVAMEDLSREIPRIETETLVIWGRRDRLAPPRTGRMLAHVMPRAQLALIERAGHVPMDDTPDQFRDVLEPFLDRGPGPVLARVRERTARGDVTCTRKNGAVYEGAFDTLTLNGCKKVVISNATVRELHVNDSSVKIEDSDIGAERGGGLVARNASIEMTNGSIRGPVAMTLTASRVDLAGVEVVGTRAAAESRDKGPAVMSSVVFSMCRVRSPTMQGDMHGYAAVVNGKPL